ncbi:MAG: Arm DNA-binding domain-containing protein [Candidatus Dormibacteraceae bacterium]
MTWALKVDIAPPGGKRQRSSASGFGAKREALEAMARLQTERADGQYVEPSKITLAQYLDTWLATGSWEGTTESEYRDSVEQRIRPYIGSLRFQIDR